MDYLLRELPEYREIGEAPTLSGERLQGYAVVWGQRSSLITGDGRPPFYEIIENGAFDLDRNITFAHRHNDNSEYGDTASGTLKLEADDYGIKYDLAIPPYAHSLKKDVRDGVVRGASIKFYYRDVSRDKDGVLHVHKGELHHIATVVRPAYPQTTVKLVNTNSNLSKYKAKQSLLENGA